MKRFTRRVLSILVGLALGWTVAGIVSGNGVSLAKDSHESHQSHQAHTDHGHGDHADQHEGAHDGGKGSDPAADAASLLVPQPGDMAWYGTVLGVAGGLFALAALLGVPALKMCGPEPSDAADDDDHGH